MLIDRQIIESLIIFAYKNEYFSLVEELLKLLNDFANGEAVRVVKNPVLRIVNDSPEEMHH